MRLRVLGASIAMALTCASCSSDAKSTDLSLGTVPPTTTTTTLPASTTTTERTTTTTIRASTTTTTAAAPTSEPPTTTTMAPETTVPATTEATTTTVELSLEDQVKADYQTARAARQQCTFDPFSCDFAAIAIPGSPTDVNVHDVVAMRIDENLRAVEGHGDVQLRVDSVGFEGDSAFVTICAYDTLVLYDIADPSNPDDDIIYNDQKNSYRARWEMRQANGQWLFYDSESLQELMEGDLCGF